MKKEFGALHERLYEVVKQFREENPELNVNYYADYDEGQIRLRICEYDPKKLVCAIKNNSITCL